MKRLAPSLSDLLARITQLEERTARAEERAARAEAKTARLENATGNIAAAVIDPKRISRRNLLMKAAGVGAAGVAGTLLINRPKDAYAIFTWQGGAANAADLETFVTANTGFTNPAVLSLDGNAGANPTANIDGIRVYGTNGFSGIAAAGGNNGGNAFYGGGGPATAASGNNGGPGATLFSGANVHNGFSGAVWIYGNGASDGTAAGYGTISFGGGNGPGGYFLGGSGLPTTPRTAGGPGVYGYGGPGGTGGYFVGDVSSLNTTIPAHGLYGAGNALGVGAWFHGGRAQIQLVPNGGIGAPTTGPHFPGDLYMDAKMVIWVCIASGAPGTFAPLQPGGINNALYTAVSTSQYTLANNDGATWVAMDASNLKLVITPNYNCQAVLSGSADLWTANAGFNQDIGIAVAGGAYPTTAGQPEGWKESGGFAGTFSPNAAHVETIVPLAAGTAYTITLVWKTNHSGTSTIAAGAGPIAAKFSPTRLSAWLVPTNPGGTIPRLPEAPYRPAEAVILPKQKDPYGRQL